jgi:hypothetical protein
MLRACEAMPDNPVATTIPVGELIRFCEAFRAALPAAQQEQPDTVHLAQVSGCASTWRPIESAPKDVNVILSNGKDVAQGWWCDEPPSIREHRDLDGRYIDQTESDGYTGWLDCDGGMLPDPTHWMPLPTPPSTGADTERARSNDPESAPVAAQPDTSGVEPSQEPPELTGLARGFEAMKRAARGVALDRVADDDLTAIEQQIAQRSRNAPFFPADANWLADVAALLVREVRAARGVPEAPDAQRLVAECAPYLKDGETPAQCIERNRKDANAAVGLLAQERAKLEAQPVAFEFYNVANGHAIVDYKEHTHVGHLTTEAGYIQRPLIYAPGVRPVQASRRTAIDEIFDEAVSAAATANTGRPKEVSWVQAASDLANHSGVSPTSHPTFCRDTPAKEG